MATDRKFVKWSSPDSIAAGKVSALAIIEVIASVAAYWWIAVTYNTHLHIFISLIAAPLVLLRSNQSVGVAEVMWEKPNKNIIVKSPLGVAIVVASTLAAGIAVDSIAKAWLIDQQGWSLIWRSAVLGLLGVNIAGALAVAGAGAVAGAVARAVAGTALVVAVVAAGAIAGAGAAAGAATGAATAAVLFLIFPGIIFGFWLRTLTIRMLSVIKYLRPGWRDLTGNWQRVMFTEDANHSPEMIPGLKQTDFNTILRTRLYDDDLWLRWLLRVIAVPIWFLPTLLWRYSLKSTVWFYLLILLISRPGALKDEASRKSRVDGPPPWEDRIGLSVALSSLLIAIIAFTDWSKAWAWFQAIQGNAPISPVGWLFVTDWSRFTDQPWKWFSLPAAILTVYLYIWINRLHSKRKGARENNLDADTICPLGSALYWTDRTRNALVILSFLVGGWYFTKASYQAGLLDPLAPVLRTLFG